MKSNTVVFHNKAIVCAVFLCTLLIASIRPGLCEGDSDAQQLMRSLFTKYHPDPNEQKETVTLSKSKEYPGALVGNLSLQKMSYFHQSWRFRKMSYEMFFSKQESMCPAIYGLAIFTKDITPEIPLSRFSSGVQGFHYAVEQVVDWLNAVKAGKFKRYDPSESFLEGRLLDDGVIKLDGGSYVKTGIVHHVLGATSGKKRSFAKNLTHERFHIVWDEDESFRQYWLDRWNNMSGEEKGRIVQSLGKKGYAAESESGVTKEWAVRSSEQCDIQRYESCHAL